MKKLGIIAIVLLVGLYGCWHVKYPSGTWRYKLTLVVETPEGIKTGSAVRKVSVFSEPKIFPEQHSAHTSVQGEAVVIDLGKYGILFALLRSNDSVDYGYNIVSAVFPYNSDRIANDINYYKNLKAKTKIII